MLFRCNINNEQDKARWEWEKSGLFPVKSTYNHFVRKNEYGLSFKQIWKAKLPLKVKIFMWLTPREVILTKDNLQRPNWKGNYSCAFWTYRESVDHLFFDCPTAKFVWSLIVYALG